MITFLLPMVRCFTGYPLTPRRHLDKGMHERGIYVQLFQVRIFMVCKSLDSMLSHIPHGIEEKMKNKWRDYDSGNSWVNQLLKIFADCLQ